VMGAGPQIQRKHPLWGIVGSSFLESAAKNEINFGRIGYPLFARARTRAYPCHVMSILDCMLIMQIRPSRHVITTVRVQWPVLQCGRLEHCLAAKHRKYWAFRRFVRILLWHK
jgi:hypothetical protein